MENVSSLVRAPEHAIGSVSGKRGVGCCERFLTPIKRVIAKIKEWVRTHFFQAKENKKEEKNQKKVEKRPSETAQKQEEDLLRNSPERALLVQAVGDFEGACRRFIEQHEACTRHDELTELYENVVKAEGRVFQLKDKFGREMVQRLRVEEHFFSLPRIFEQYEQKLIAIWRNEYVYLNPDDSEEGSSSQ